MRTIDADRLIESMGEPKDYFEELVRNVMKDFVDEQPTVNNDSSWVLQTYTNGFGTFKALRCEKVWNEEESGQPSLLRTLRCEDGQR